MKPRSLPRILAPLALVAAVAPAHAYTTFLDTFTVSNNLGVILNDTFDDGIIPPLAQNCALASAPACYSTDPAVFPGSESGGKLRLDTSLGSHSESAAGNPRQVVRGRLLTPRTTDPATGLKKGNTFEVSAVYDLVLPGPGDAAQIRLTDAHATAGETGDRTDYLQLGLRMSQELGAVPEIRLLGQNFQEGTVTTEATRALDTSLGADQIRLILSHTTANSLEIVASWEYLKAGVVLAADSFSERPTIFDGENWTRADFIVSAVPVPEPETYAMMLLGLGFVAWRVRRRLR
jgi:hypothetical protein